MEDKNNGLKKWFSILFSFPISIIWLSMLFVFLITGLPFLSMNSQRKVFSDQAGEMVNIVTEAREQDKDRFFHYQVVDIPENSKERIAVRFNTMDEKNIGIIDEYGNVIKEPFLQDKSYNHCGEYITLDKFINYGNYIDLSYFDGGIYNLDLERVVLTEKEKETWDEFKHLKETRIGVDFNVNEKEIIKIYQYFDNPKDYRLRYLNQKGENGIYIANLITGDGLFNTIYVIFLDENYDLASHFYYSPYDENMLSSPSEGSKVGIVYIKNLGQVYFNLDGEIIWITYCD